MRAKPLFQLADGHKPDPQGTHHVSLDISRLLTQSNGYWVDPPEISPLSLAPTGPEWLLFISILILHQLRTPAPPGLSVCSNSHWWGQIRGLINLSPSGASVNIPFCQQMPWYHLTLDAECLMVYFSSTSSLNWTPPSGREEGEMLCISLVLRMLL